MKTKQQTQGIMIILQAIYSRHRESTEDVQFKKFLFFNKHLTNPYADYSYSDIQNVHVVREFVRQLYGFDKGTSRISLTRHAFNVKVLCIFTKCNYEDSFIKQVSLFTQTR